MTGHRELKIREGVESLQDLCHSRAKKAGWWESLCTGEVIPCSTENFLSKIALVHSELSEALEGKRKGLMDDHLPQYPMETVELGDAIIRIMDLAGKYQLDIAGAIISKLEYNLHRDDHKIENRKKCGGKKS